MDSRDYEQIEIPGELAADAKRWMLPNDEVDILFVDEQPTDVQVPSAVEMKVTTTEPGVKGDTASGGGSKAATLESGVTVQVPLFIEEGESVRVDTRSGEYVSRASWLERQNRHICAGPTNAATPSSPATSAMSPGARSRSCSPTPRPFTRELALGVESHRAELDAVISRHAKGWDLDRIAPLERNVMRVALYEIEHSDDVPTEVAIDEAVNIAKEYCGSRRAWFRQRDPRRRGPRGGSLMAGGPRTRGCARSPSACRRSPPSSRARAPTTSGPRSWPARPPSSPAEAVEEANRRIREADAGSNE